MADKLSTGLDRKTAAALSYVLLFVSGAVFLVLEKDSYVRFHAAQSVVVFGAYFLLSMFLGVFNMGFLNQLASLLGIVAFVLWLVLIYKAWLGEEWEVPVLGEWSKKLVKKV